MSQTRGDTISCRQSRAKRLRRWRKIWSPQKS